MVDGVEARGAKKDDEETKQCPELADATAEAQEFSLEFGVIEIENVETSNPLLVSSEPSHSGGPGNAEVRCDADVPGPANELSEPVVVGSSLSHPSILDRSAGSSMARGCRRQSGAEQSRTRTVFSRML